MNATLEDSAVPTRRWPAYATVWRWHFYAGLLCLPFILWLPLTGAIYLFKPQIERWLDAPYERLAVDGRPASPSAQVAAALAVVPGTVLHSYVLPQTPQSAVQVLVGRGRELHRVYLHPESLALLKVEREDLRPMRLLFHLHGELLLGSPGSMIVETAASWTIVMILTGLYLWWPRGGSIAGVVYPRLGRGGRTFWRDLHAVTGLWIAFFVLFLLVSGLPWAKFWGGTLKELRQLGSAAAVRLDWTTGRASELAERAEMNAPAGGHGAHAGSGDAAPDYAVLDRVVATTAPLQIAAPVLISPPSRRNPQWNARSDHPNRTLHVKLTFDGATGAIATRRAFADAPLLDRIIGIGVSAHEGQLFGWPNQLLGLLTAAGLVLMAVSSAVLWWRRRAPGTLGAPPAVARSGRTAIALAATIVMLGVLLPLFALTAAAVLALERWVLRRLPAARAFLGLTPAASGVSAR